MMLWFSDTASFVTESNMYLTSCSAVTRCQTWIDENGNMDQTIDLRASSSIIRRIVALVRDYDKRAAVKILFNSCRDAYTNTRRYCSSPVDLLWSNHIQEDRQQLQGQHDFIMVSWRCISYPSYQLWSIPTVGTPDPFTSYIGAFQFLKHAKEIVEAGYYKVIIVRWNIRL